MELNQRVDDIVCSLICPQIYSQCLFSHKTKPEVSLFIIVTLHMVEFVQTSKSCTVNNMKLIT